MRSGPIMRSILRSKRVIIGHFLQPRVQRTGRRGRQGSRRGPQGQHLDHLHQVSPHMRCFYRLSPILSLGTPWGPRHKFSRPPVFEVGAPWGPHLAIIQLGTLCDHGMVQADRGKLKSDLEVRDQGVVRGPQHQIMLGTPSDFFRARTYTISQCCVYLNPWHHKHPLV